MARIPVLLKGSIGTCHLHQTPLASLFQWENQSPLLFNEDYLSKFKEQDDCVFPMLRVSLFTTGEEETIRAQYCNHSKMKEIMTCLQCSLEHTNLKILENETCLD
ncbi:hypothetical protein I310_05952 [Cryptococcus deuterogattii CA1014]|nr:hypothetical protein I310_05952 [Cryptococcus deuterogattii CA1014]